jgi:hypothetical protein
VSERGSVLSPWSAGLVRDRRPSDNLNSVATVFFFWRWDRCQTFPTSQPRTTSKTHRIAKVSSTGLSGAARLPTDNRPAPLDECIIPFMADRETTESRLEPSGLRVVDAICRSTVCGGTRRWSTVGECGFVTTIVTVVSTRLSGDAARVVVDPPEPVVLMVVIATGSFVPALRSRPRPVTAASRSNPGGSVAAGSHQVDTVRFGGRRESPCDTNADIRSSRPPSTIADSHVRYKRTWEAASETCPFYCWATHGSGQAPDILGV